MGQIGAVGEDENAEPAGTPEASCAGVQRTSGPFTRKNGLVPREDELKGSFVCVHGDGDAPAEAGP